MSYGIPKTITLRFTFQNVPVQNCKSHDVVSKLQRSDSREGEALSIKPFYLCFGLLLQQLFHLSIEPALFRSQNTECQRLSTNCRRKGENYGGEVRWDASPEVGAARCFARDKSVSQVRAREPSSYSKLVEARSQLYRSQFF